MARFLAGSPMDCRRRNAAERQSGHWKRKARQLAGLFRLANCSSAALAADCQGQITGVERFCGELRVVDAARQIERFPDLDQRVAQGFDHHVGMERRRGDAQPLGALGHGRVVDRLDVDIVPVHQHVGGCLAGLGLTDNQRHDMGLGRHDRQTRFGQNLLGPFSLALMAGALVVRVLQMLDRRTGSGAERRRQGGGEDELGSIGPDGVDDRLLPGDVAAHGAEALGQRALDDIDAVGQSVAVGDAAAARSVDAHGMDFVDVGQGAIFLGEIGDLCDRRHVTIHRIDRLEDNELGARAVGGFEQFAQVSDVVVTEDLLLHARLPDAGNHRGVIELIAEDQAIGQKARNGRDRCFVGDEAGGEDQSRFLAMQVRERALELDQLAIGARDIACAAGAGAHLASRLLHGGDDLLVLAHAEIVVRTPDGDLALIVGAVAENGPRELSGDTFQIGEDAITAFVSQGIERVLEGVAVVEHGHFLRIEHPGMSPIPGTKSSGKTHCQQNPASLQTIRAPHMSFLEPFEKTGVPPA